MTTIRPGLCSVTFRAHTPEQIIEAAAAAKLEVIEWGGDVHVPPGDVRTAERVATATRSAGLLSCSYGSYYRATPSDELAPVLDSAEALGVDRVRIWAGRTASKDVSVAERDALADRLQDAAEAAAQRGIRLALEYHARTLTDTVETTEWLLQRVPALSTYWQPDVGAPDDVALAAYRTLESRVDAVHVFSWWPTIERLPLSARESLWRAFVHEVSLVDRAPRDALLEFVPDDDIDVLAREAQTLRDYLGCGLNAGAAE
ncbi:sugar phosphate isomerase/epimerase [Microbacterium keratanolyticum]|uniref:Sugar phosphate isomerase n=1 Tax=Microbacterium keratanolyticum TaxID=67574 RepID=A0A9W6HR34_9MICO|nr:TIM barrel protein [Microbacterium keratanolyticum]MBM7469266.1 sugar phosphate isomerase/epimerase [Microbacterium keratanolyticum]GLK01346.1 sugar phosphate isomerase [Microbacterium keratanolyticum]